MKLDLFLLWLYLENGEFKVFRKGQNTRLGDFYIKLMAGLKSFLSQKLLRKVQNIRLGGFDIRLRLKAHCSDGAQFDAL